MTRWIIILTIICSLCLTGIAQAATIAGELSDRLETDRYDCILELSPAKTLNQTAAVRVMLEAKDANETLFVVVMRASIAIYHAKGRNNKSLVAKVSEPGIVPGTPYRLTIMRREKSLGLLHGNTLLYRGDVPRGPGELAGVTMDSGWANASEPRVQRLEPVHFEDDFMRAGADQGPWAKQSGIWELKSAWDESPQGGANAKANAAAGYGQNPFAMVGSSKWDKNAPNIARPAIATAGDPFWEDYTFSVAVQPGKDSVLGVAVNMSDPNNGLLIRWTPVIAQGSLGRLTLHRVENGKIKDAIASSPGGFLPLQWYQLTVISSLTGVKVFVDGIERINKTNITPWRGGIALYAEGFQGVLFDDVKVFGRTFDTDLLFETQQTDINKRFENDPNGMASWANPKSDWTAAVGMPGHFWFRRDVYGDHQWMALSVKPLKVQTGELWMTLKGDGTNPTNGLRAVAQVTPDPAKVTYTLYQDDKLLASKTESPPPTSDSEYSFRFWHSGTEIWLEVDGEIVVKAGNVKPATGLRPAYRAIGCFANSHDQVVLSHHMLDYTFSNAPTDWLYDGAWEPTIRWSCAPNWSFLGGWSRGDAVLWHKQRFTGDHAIEAFVGVKMEFPREREIYDNRFHDFNLTICGDGRNPRSGYTGIYATTDKKIALYRNGIEVASQPLPKEMIPTRSHHRSWFNPELRKRGNIIEFSVTFAWLPPQKDAAGNVIGPRTLVLTYTDENPIAGGVPAVWTSDNGITIARARISFAAPPKPRTEPLITLMPPWFPEWVNVGDPLTLHLADIWASSGKATRLVVTPRNVPAGDESAVKTDGARLLFTPQHPGRSWSDNHWYEIKATDGDTFSSSMHLDVHVFDPKANKRDDSRAVLLYRFNEGKGDLVKDHSGKTPAADLNILSDTQKGQKDGGNPDNHLTAQWLPGQGLSLRVDSRVFTAGKSGGMDRVLQAIQQSRACVIELWVSTDTVYPPHKPDLGWASFLFSWDNSGTAKDSQRNLTVMQQSTGVAIYPRDVPVATNNSVLFGGSIRTGLMHIVISWDGTKTTLFCNGEPRGERTIPWNIEKMTPGSLLILGNGLDYKSPYLGAYYLLAIHDRPFTQQQAKQHYLAGPSGR